MIVEIGCDEFGVELRRGCALEWSVPQAVEIELFQFARAHPPRSPEDAGFRPGARFAEHAFCLHGSNSLSVITDQYASAPGVFAWKPADIDVPAALEFVPPVLVAFAQQTGAVVYPGITTCRSGS